MAPKGVAVHYVGNPGSSAKGNRAWFESGAGGALASAHYIIGLDGEILRIIPEDERASHAGKSYGKEWDAIAPSNNGRLIGIECCHPDAGGEFNAKTRAALVELVADICARRGFDPSKDVARHYDVAGKRCPLFYVNNPAAWKALLADFESALGAGGAPILGPPSAACGQMLAWAKKNGAAEWLIDAAPVFFSSAEARGVDPAAAYAQSAKETGFGKFGGVVDASFHNPCGLKTAAGGGDGDPSAHMRFAGWPEGIDAQMDHLALYAGAPGYPRQNTADPRHFPWILGAAKTVEALGGKWAPSPSYGKEIAKMMREIAATPAPADNPAPGSAEDSNEPSSWAAEDWKWAKDIGATDGASPQAPATREMVVSMLRRALAFKNPTQFS
jgi:hypothetical protein